jgi:two-component system cell cycle response regulator
VEPAPTVLVADDQPLSRETTARILREGGFRVVTCADGQEVIDRAGTEHPDAVVLDVVMPRMHGHEVCRTLKRIASRAGEHLPILFLSSRSDPPSRVEGLRAGADDFLGKPYDAEELRARVEAMVRTRRLVGQIMRRPRPGRTTDPGPLGQQIDALTGLFDRRFLTERLDDEFARAEENAEPLALLALDLDLFDRINSRFGRSSGDRLLAACARAITRVCRDRDIVTHPGGDEYVVILPGTHFAAALATAERIWRAVKQATIVEQGQNLSCEASIGVACFPGREILSTRDLLRFAHAALSRAKAEGRGRICVYQYQGYLLQPQ